jgi:TolB protein
LKRWRLAVAAVLLLALGSTGDDPTLLDAPPAEESELLELAAGLDRPPAPPGATRSRSLLPPPPPPEAGRSTSGLTPLAAARPMAPARVGFEISGMLGPIARSALASDLAYVRSLRVEDDCDFLISGRAQSGSFTLSLRRSSDGIGFTRSYQGADFISFLHTFADDVVESLTGRRAAFSSRIAFGQRVARGRKDIMVADADGRGLTRVSSGHGIATLPAFGPEGVFYSVATPTGVFITQSGTDDHPIVGGNRTNMGARFCGGRLYFASSRDGNMDIYSVRPDGSDEQRLTAHDGLDLSPTCAPGGGIAFVSNRRGNPQIFLARGAPGEPEQLTRGEYEAQTPSLCGRWLAYTEVGDGMRIMVLDRRTGVATRISPARGEHKDPAFSPDCRMIAWSSPRGIIVARRDGRLPRVIVPGRAETIRWER